MLAKSFLSIVTATAFYCKVSDRGDYTRLYQVLGAWLVAFICRFFWYEYLSNPLSSIPRIQSDWQTRVYRWMYTEPTPIQLREWVKASPNDGLLRYYGIGGSPRLLLTNAEAVKEAFVTQQYSQFEKPELIRLRTGNNIGFGLSATTGKVHRVGCAVKSCGSCC